MYTRQCNCKNRFEYYISADSSLRLKNVGKLKLSSRLVTVPNDDKASCALNKHINSFAGCTPPHLLPLFLSLHLPDNVAYRVLSVATHIDGIFREGR
jgi:hypothetical protein